MSTSQYAPSGPLPKVPGTRVAVIATDWNSVVTDRLVASALEVFRKEGFEKDDVEVFHVPGAIELTFAASQIIETSLFDVVIVFGCVIRGGTPHFDYVCQSVTQGITALNADCDTPVIFGVLTVDNLQDALDRAGGAAGDKGREAAETAIKMRHFVCKVQDL